MAASHGCGSVYYPRTYFFHGPFAHLRSLRIHYDGRFHGCTVGHEVDYVNGLVLWIHNIDPQRFEIQNLFQLLKTKLPEGVPHPDLAWFAKIDEPWPESLKPLHRNEDLEELFADLDAKREKCGVVYLQWDATLEDPSDGELIYTLPAPLNDHDEFANVREVHAAADKVMRDVATFGPELLKTMVYERDIPMISEKDWFDVSEL